MIILFAAAAAEAFIELPDSTKRRAAKSLQLLKSHPNVYPVRQRGLTRGYRYFVAGQHLFYYKLSLQEVRVPRSFRVSCAKPSWIRIDLASNIRRHIGRIHLRYSD